MKNKKIIVFDKDDTITEAKTEIEPEMAKIFSDLLNKYKVAIITGWDFSNIYNQIVKLLPIYSKLENLYLFPTIGTCMYYFSNWKWIEKYSENLSKEEADKITFVLNRAIDKLDLRPKKIWWEIVENRWSQITYSALWQKAPLKEKQKFDPDKKIRKKLVNYIKNDLCDYSIWIWWTTSIDITRKGLNKAYWIKKMLENLDLKKEDILFIWDALFPWWNDYPVKEFGVDCIKVNNLKDTIKVIKDLLY